MSWPFMALILKLENDALPMYWGALPGGVDGWTSRKSAAYRWSADTPIADAVKNGIPTEVKDLHGRTFELVWYRCGVRLCVEYRNDKLGEGPMRLVPWERL